MERRNRGGRPIRTPELGTGERVGLSLRVTPECKARLDRAAQDSGRSLSQEAERLIEASLGKEELLSGVLQLAYGRQLAALLMTLGYVMRWIGRERALGATHSFDAMDRWLEVPYAAAEAISAAKRVLEGYRPAGDPKFPEEINGLPVAPPGETGVESADVLLRFLTGREVPPTQRIEQFVEQTLPLLDGLQIRVPDAPKAEGQDA